MSHKFYSIYISLVMLLLFLTNPYVSISQDEIYKNLNEFQKELENKKINKKRLILLENNLQKKLNTINSNLSINQKKLNQIKIDQDVTNKKLLDLEKNKINLKNNLIVFQKHKSMIINKLIEIKLINDSKPLQVGLLSNSLYNIRNKIYEKEINLKKLTKKKQSSKGKKNSINTNLSHLSKKIKKDQVKIKSLIGESIIAAIDKKENTVNIEKISKKARKLKLLIDELAKKTANKNNSLTKGILANNLLPISNSYVENIATGNNRTGIIITTKDNGKLISPEKGLVVYASYFRGYGNMVIIDLGKNYHLILSGLKDINCFVGDWLEKGDGIGTMGNQKNNKKLYLEVRKNGKTLNPNKWNQYSKIN